MANSYPYTWEPLSEQDDATVKHCFGDVSSARELVRSKPELMRANASFKNHCEKVRNIKVRPDDVWVVTHPKCGTTWTQEMTWMIMNGVKLEETKKDLFERSPFIDMPMIRNYSKSEVDKFFDKELEALPSPRLIKTHYPFELLPPNLLDTCKVLYVCRNVKDACVSYFHHESLMKSHDLRCDFITYAREIYRPGLCLHGGFFEMLESGWKRRNHPNIMFYWYEDLKQDQEGMLRKIANFTGFALTEDQIKRLNEHMKFDNYQKSSSLNKKVPNWFEGKGQFIRKGIVGDWMNHFTPELNKEYNGWIRENLDRIGVNDQTVRSYFTLDVKF